MYIRGGDGAEVIYALRNDDDLSKSIGENFIKVNQNFRKYYQRRLPSDSSLDYYFMHRDTPNNETIIVEYGFLDSTKDDVMQLKNNWKNLAEAVLMAIVPYAGGVYKPLDDEFIYVIKPGDTLYEIAINNNTTINKLKEINKLDSDKLSIGQIIYLPGIEDSKESRYVVVSGDSLYKIANKFNISVDEIKRLNNLENNNLKIGQVLIIKDTDIKEPDNNLDSTNTYIVKPGDTLYKIANEYNLTVDEIKKINNLSSDELSVGQTLKLVSVEEPENTYMVKSGDTLYSIAKVFETDINKLKLLNNLKSNMLSVGQVLLIPNNNSYQKYTVKSNDNLYKIANNFNTSINKIKEINNLSSDILSIGQILLVPYNT